jgi:DNA ligase (NAD+)
MNQKELESYIKKCQEAYYNDDPIIDDKDFDELWDELETKYPDSELLVEVGETSWDGFNKEKHIMSMCSQQKAGTIAAFEKWVNKNNIEDYIVEYKCDGISLSLQYEDGKFIRALTRGNGIVGDDISANVRKMQGFNNLLKENVSGGFRAEIVMTHKTFDTKYKDTAKNPRNITSGLSKRKDGEGCEDLTLIYYDCQLKEKDLEDEFDKLDYLIYLFDGFVVYSMKTSDANEIIRFRNKIMGMRDEIDYDIDGLVIKDNIIDLEDMKRSRPKKQIAFKFETEKAHTKLIDVEWSESGANYTPVGIVEPVELNGTTVKRASLANLALISELGLKIGDIVEISKRGEIIPKIEQVVEVSGSGTPIIPPNHCYCGASLVSDGTFLTCPNKDCPKKKLHRLFKWIDKLDCKFFGEVMIRTLFEKDLITYISDLYTCDLEHIISEMETIDGFSRNNITKAFNNLYKVQELSLSKFVGGYDIDGVGERIVEIVIKNSNGKYNSLDSLWMANPFGLASIKQIGEKKAGQIIMGVCDNMDDMRKTLASGRIKIIEKKIASNKLEGKSFCITGSLEHGKRDDYVEKIKDNGGEYKSGVSAGLSYLVNNDLTSTSGKNKKAQELNVPIISEDELLEMMK